MLATQHRLHRSSDFGAVVKQGRKKGRRLVVVYCRTDDAPVRTGGPRFGLIVSKAVGNAVIRHRVSRRLRHICAGLIPEISEDTMIVIRALPPASRASSDELESDVRGALRSAFAASDRRVSETRS